MDDNEYLFLNAVFSEQCSALTIELGAYLQMHRPDRVESHKLVGKEAFDFLKETIYGQQSEMSNFAVLVFSPDTTYNDIGLNLTVKIPSIGEVMHKKNKFDTRKRKIDGETMTIPIVDFGVLTKENTKKLYEKVSGDIRAKLDAIYDVDDSEDNPTPEQTKQIKQLLKCRGVK